MEPGISLNNLLKFFVTNLNVLNTNLYIFRDIKQTGKAKCLTGPKFDEVYVHIKVLKTSLRLFQHLIIPW